MPDDALAIVKAVLLDTGAVKCGDLAKVVPEATLREQLGLDSLDAIEMAMTLESQHGIEIPDDELRRAKTVGEMVAAIERAQARKAAA